MAMDGTRVTGSEGIVDEDIDQSITNLGCLASQGMVETDVKF
jgi:L-cysteine desulfidase